MMLKAIALRGPEMVSSIFLWQGIKAYRLAGRPEPTSERVLAPRIDPQQHDKDGAHQRATREK
jgi:hypothetical protein